MTRIVRILATLGLALFVTAACGGGGSAPQSLTPPVDTELDWDDGTWDSENWQ